LLLCENVFERLLCGRYGIACVDLIRQRDLADHLVVGRIDEIDDLLSMGRYELPVDICLVEYARCSRSLHRNVPARKGCGA